MKSYISEILQFQKEKGRNYIDTSKRFFFLNLCAYNKCKKSNQSKKSLSLVVDMSNNFLCRKSKCEEYEIGIKLSKKEKEKNDVQDVEGS